MNERELPDLRILPSDALVLHEDTDPDRTERLVAVLKRDQVLKNPPIVAPMPDSERFVVLDGANRTTSILAMGIPHVLVQVVDYDTVELDTWNHVVTGMPEQELFRAVRGIPGLTLEEGNLLQARILLTARRCLGYLICPEGEVYIMRGGESLLQEVHLLNQVVHLYKGLGKIYRIKTDNLHEQEQYYDEIAALMVFPRFTPADIVTLAGMDEKLPTGITRHVIPQRALRLNYDLRELANRERTVGEKNDELMTYIRERLQARRIRVYQESTVLYDE